jgi:hypothetical protein
MKIGSIVIRCYEFKRMLAFWREAIPTPRGSLQKAVASCFATPKA